MEYDLHKIRLFVFVLLSFSVNTTRTASRTPGKLHASGAIPAGRTVTGGYAHYDWHCWISMSQYERREQLEFHKKSKQQTVLFRICGFNFVSAVSLLYLPFWGEKSCICRFLYLPFENYDLYTALWANIFRLTDLFQISSVFTELRPRFLQLELPAAVQEKIGSIWHLCAPKAQRHFPLISLDFPLVGSHFNPLDPIWSGSWTAASPIPFQLTYSYRS